MNEKGELESVLTIRQQIVQCNVIQWHKALADRRSFTRCYDFFENLPAVYNVQ